MSTVALSGSDTIMLNNRIMNDLADGDVGHLTFPNDIATLKTGKNGNSIYSLNQTGKQAELAIRVIRGSSDDKYLNGLIVQQQANFAGTILNFGEFIKQIGDGKGNISLDTYIMSGGILTKIPEAKSNVEGDTAQSVIEYHLKFSNSPRVIT